MPSEFGGIMGAGRAPQFIRDRRALDALFYPPRHGPLYFTLLRAFSKPRPHHRWRRQRNPGGPRAGFCHHHGGYERRFQRYSPLHPAARDATP